ncbi:MAG: hypothetical protein ABIO29_00480 [Sphingomicrobium sp.]
MFDPPLHVADKVARTPQREAVSAAVVELFHEACEKGVLKLPASKGRVLKGKEADQIAGRYFWSTVGEGDIVVRFNYPARTFLLIGNRRRTSSISIVRSCIVVSYSMTTFDASRAMTWNIDKGEAKPLWWPDMFFPTWTYDRPDLGFKKILSLDEDKAVRLSVLTYANAPHLSEPAIKQ